MTIMERFKQWRCPHFQTATRTWFDDGAVHRQGVCLECGTTTAPDPLPHDELVRLLDEAVALRDASVRPPNPSLLERRK